MTATRDPRTGATNHIQCKEGDKVINILEACTMNTEIERVAEKRFELANSAPIQTLLLQQLVGFCALTSYAKDLLQGELAIPTDIEKATTELIQEMQQLWMRLQPFHEHIPNVMPELYKYYWGRAHKSTSLALSKIHFRHWKAWQLSLELTKLACSQLNLIACTGVPPSRWGNCLQVLLEMVLGVHWWISYRLFFWWRATSTFSTSGCLVMLRSASCTIQDIFRKINTAKRVLQLRTPSWTTTSRWIFYADSVNCWSRYQPRQTNAMIKLTILSCHLYSWQLEGRTDL